MVLAGDLFQGKIEELFKGLPTMFDIVDDILNARFDYIGRDHKTTLDKVLRICRQANLKPNKDKCMYYCTSIPFFGEVMS